MKKIVGIVTEEEKKEIQSLFERRSGLCGAVVAMKVMEALYEKMVKDLGETRVKFQSWWDRMAHKYKWESAENGKWEIDFNTNEICLICEL